MKQREETERHASPLEAQQAVRKPYRKPAVRYERMFETSAMVCGKVQSYQQNCHNNRKTS